MRIGVMRLTYGHHPPHLRHHRRPLVDSLRGFLTAATPVSLWYNVATRSATRAPHGPRHPGHLDIKVVQSMVLGPMQLQFAPARDDS